jgi:hypothetical protein
MLLVMVVHLVVAVVLMLVVDCGQKKIHGASYQWFKQRIPRVFRLKKNSVFIESCILTIF